MNKRISVIFENSKIPFLSIDPEYNVQDALELLASKDLGALVVVENDQVVGIFSERDFVKRVVIPKKDHTKIKIRDVMTTEVFCGTSDWDTEECLRLMDEKQIRHIPIVDNGKLIGCLSVLDVITALLAAKQTAIKDLESYVSKNWPL